MLADQPTYGNRNSAYPLAWELRKFAKHREQSETVCCRPPACRHPHHERPVNAGTSEDAGVQLEEPQAVEHHHGGERRQRHELEVAERGAVYRVRVAFISHTVDVARLDTDVRDQGEQLRKTGSGGEETPWAVLRTR